MRVLIGCEFSGIVREAFRKRGHTAVSVDLLPSEDNSRYHKTGNVIHHLKDEWDLGIFFPPCTHLAVSGARWFPAKRADGRQQKAIDFVRTLWKAPIDKVAIENPIGVLSTQFASPTQIIQPWMFGHGEVKATCLWLRNLPKLEPTKIVSGRIARVHREPPSEHRWKNRSRTLQGIADAMADQWG